MKGRVKAGNSTVEDPSTLASSHTCLIPIVFFFPRLAPLSSPSALLSLYHFFPLFLLSTALSGSPPPYREEAVHDSFMYSSDGYCGTHCDRFTTAKMASLSRGRSLFVSMPRRCDSMITSVAISAEML